MAPLSLIDILSNEYLLLATTPYLLPTELLALARCSHSYYSLVTHSRSVWRHLNLSAPPRALPSHSSTAIALRSPTPIYQTELTTLLSKPFVLRDVKTLVLDGLPVTADLLRGLLTAPEYRIQLLSIRECSQINERELMVLFKFITSPKREHGPTLKGCYYFGNMDAPGGNMDAPGGILPSLSKARDPGAKGRFLGDKINADWVDVVRQCQGLIAFDTRLCHGPRHEEGNANYAQSQLANVRLSACCAGCGSAAEARGSQDAPSVVAAPVPITTSDLRVACRTACRQQDDVLWCESCVKDRWCESCDKWWCETCTEDAGRKVRNCRGSLAFAVADRRRVLEARIVGLLRMRGDVRRLHSEDHSLMQGVQRRVLHSTVGSPPLSAITTAANLARWTATMAPTIPGFVSIILLLFWMGSDACVRSGTWHLQMASQCAKRFVSDSGGGWW